MCDRVSKERARGRGPAAARQCVSAATWLQPSVCVMTAGDVSVCAPRLRDPDDRGERERERGNKKAALDRALSFCLLCIFGEFLLTPAAALGPLVSSL